MSTLTDVKLKVECYTCGNNNFKMTKCKTCKKIICYDCKDITCMGKSNVCFWCKSKKYNNKK